MEVWIIVMHFTVSVLGFTGDGHVVPRDTHLRKAYSTEAACKAAVPAARRFLANKLPAQPDRYDCIKMEIVK